MAPLLPFRGRRRRMGPKYIRPHPHSLSKGEGSHTQPSLFEERNYHDALKKMQNKDS